MKSKAMEVNGRVYKSEGMGKRGGLGFVGLFFLDWQMSRSSPHKTYCMATKRRRSWD